MGIRKKLLVLLLCVAFFPLALSIVIYHSVLADLGDHFASDLREFLVENAEDHLLTLTDAYGRLHDGRLEALEQAMKVLARDVETELAGDSDRDSFPLRSPATERPQSKGGTRSVDKRIDRENPELERTFRLVSSLQPELISRILVVMESGKAVNWPQSEGFSSIPELQDQRWHSRTRQTGALSWSVIQNSQGPSLMLRGAMPVYYPGGSSAGIVAVDVSLNDLYERPLLPDRWLKSGEVFLVTSVPLSC